jgi:hypothetical protein
VETGEGGNTGTPKPSVVDKRRPERWVEGIVSGGGSQAESEVGHVPLDV